MGWKFRKRVRIVPGFYLNLSKSGLSATVGMRGMSLNIGKKGNYLNAGIPGTGVYNRVKLGENNSLPVIYPSLPSEPIIPNESSSSQIDIKSFKPEVITSEGLFGLKESIINAKQIKIELLEECLKAKSAKSQSHFLLLLSYIFIFGFFIKSFRNNYIDRKNDFEAAEDSYNTFKLCIDFNFDPEIKKEYLTFKRSFESLFSADSIWDVTTTQKNDRLKTRSVADSAVSKQIVKFELSSLDFINTDFEAFKLQNANGGNLYIYPGFIVVLEKDGDEFGLIDYRDLKITHHSQQFIETAHVPSDTKTVSHTWKYVNKNGLPDKRFSNNYQIPIVLYYEMSLESNSGLNECYEISNPNTGETFCKAFESYRNAMQSMKWNGEQNQ